MCPRSRQERHGSPTPDVREELEQAAAKLTASGGLEKAAAKLTAAWDVRGIDIGTLSFSRGTAVDRSSVAPASTSPEALPSLLAPGPQGAKPQFEMGDVLGEGGMGVVRTAKQTALRRDVAVKMLKPGAGQSEVPQLLREARVTGVLEHPNVVPIYALGRDNDGRPLIVMKRISGESWSAEIEGADDVERHTDAFLRKHLAILKQVAIAAHYAHSKGIVHRDLKPENVMIGNFGEVYLVDWGIAVSLNNDNPGVPGVGDITAIEGTPGYMAPEMAAADGAVIDERSDVYLLGAILHEIVTGEPPHDGETVVKVLTAAFASEPHAYEDGVAGDLQRICHRSMARWSDERYPSALAFAAALDEFLVHRSSTLLSDEAAVRLRETRDLLSSASGGQMREHERLYAKFGECRFAFQQALRSWPENANATNGLQQTLELMVEHELSRESPRAALALTLQFPRENASLRRRVDRALRQKKRAQERLASLERDQDLSIGASKRRVIGLALASLWVAACIGAGVVNRTGLFDVTHNAFALVTLSFGIGALLSALRQRRSILITDINRRLTVFTVLGFTTYTGLWLYAGLVNMPKDQTTVVQAIMSGTLWLAVGLTINRLWLVMGYGGLASAVMIVLFPRYHWEVLGLVGGLSSVFVTYCSFESKKPEEV